MDGQGQVTSRRVDELSDVDEVGLSTQLLFSIPLLRALVQAVAESDGDWNYLNVTVSSGAWVGVARRSGENQLLVSTNNGGRTSMPCPPAIDEALRAHGFQFLPNRSRHNALDSTRAWQRLSARLLRAWRGEHGNWCPGYQRAARSAADLTVDHVVPLAAGGAPFDIANTSVLCRSYNSTKGASTDRGGVAHSATAIPPDRALRVRFLGRVSRFLARFRQRPIRER